MAANREVAPVRIFPNQLTHLSVKRVLILARSSIGSQHAAVNRGVVGSSPTVPAISKFALFDRLLAKIMIDTKIKGNANELECMLAFTQLGIQVSIPFGEDSRYDFIADVKGQLLRIQCKACSEVFDGENNVVGIKFKTCRQSGSKANNWTRSYYTKDDIDYFATSYNHICYLIPVEQCSNEKMLRFVPPKNNQKIGINFAKDFTLQEVIGNL